MTLIGVDQYITYFVVLSRRRQVLLLKDFHLNLLLLCFLEGFNCDRNMADKLINLFSPDSNDETEDIKRCTQLSSEALTSNQFSKLIKRMVIQGFDTDWKVKKQLNWLQTKKETEKCLTVCVHSWVC